MDAETTLTVEQAYETTFRWLDRYFRATGSSSDDIGALLGSMQPMPIFNRPDDFKPDWSETADPAVWGEWLGCAAETLRGDPYPWAKR